MKACRMPSCPAPPSGVPGPESQAAVITGLLARTGELSLGRASIEIQRPA